MFTLDQEAPTILGQSQDSAVRNAGAESGHGESSVPERLAHEPFEVPPAVRCRGNSPSHDARMSLERICRTKASASHDCILTEHAHAALRSESRLRSMIGLYRAQIVDDLIDQLGRTTAPCGVFPFISIKFPSPNRHLRRAMSARHGSPVDDAVDFLAGKAPPRRLASSREIRHLVPQTWRNRPVAVSPQAVTAGTKFAIQLARPTCRVPPPHCSLPEEQRAPRGRIAYPGAERSAQIASGSPPEQARRERLQCTTMRRARLLERHPSGDPGMRRPQRQGCYGPRLSAVIVALGLAALSPVAVVADEPSLPKSIDEAVRMERADALPRTAFYGTPALHPSMTGALLRQEAGVRVRAADRCHGGTHSLSLAQRRRQGCGRFRRRPHPGREGTTRWLAGDRLGPWYERGRQTMRALAAEGHGIWRGGTDADGQRGLRRRCHGLSRPRYSRTSSSTSTRSAQARDVIYSVPRRPHRRARARAALGSHRPFPGRTWPHGAWRRWKGRCTMPIISAPFRWLVPPISDPSSMRWASPAAPPPLSWLHGVCDEGALPRVPAVRHAGRRSPRALRRCDHEGLLELRLCRFHRCPCRAGTEAGMGSSSAREPRFFADDELGRRADSRCPCS